MAYHKGNALLTNVVADDLRTAWVEWTPSRPLTNDGFVSIDTSSSIGRYFSTRNLAVLSIEIRLTLATTTPSPYSVAAIALPETLRVRPGTSFRSPATVERETRGAERVYGAASIYVDGVTRGGADGTTFLYLDRMFIQNLSQFLAGQSYVVRGQLIFSPSSFS